MFSFGERWNVPIQLGCRLVEWNIPSFTEWKYSYHCTHKHSLFVYTISLYHILSHYTWLYPAQAALPIPLPILSSLYPIPLPYLILLYPNLYILLIPMSSILPLLSVEWDLAMLYSVFPQTVIVYVAETDHPLPKLLQIFQNWTHEHQYE